VHARTHSLGTKYWIYCRSVTIISWSA
jgi:hypothetical protein